MSHQKPLTKHKCKSKTTENAKSVIVEHLLKCEIFLSLQPHKTEQVIHQQSKSPWWQMRGRKAILNWAIWIQIHGLTHLARQSLRLCPEAPSKSFAFYVHYLQNYIKTGIDERLALQSFLFTDKAQKCKEPRWWHKCHEPRAPQSIGFNISFLSASLLPSAFPLMTHFSFAAP